MLLAIAAGLFRLLPSWLRPWNLAPIGAVGIFGGARLRSWHAYAIPIALMVLSDGLLWATLGPDYGLFHYSRVFVYGSFLGYVVLGRLLARTESPLRIGAVTLMGSVQFFLITNFGEWLFSPNNFPKTWDGLMQCYAFALPFFDKTVISDLGFSALLFAVHAWLSRTVAPSERVALQPN